MRKKFIIILLFLALALLLIWGFWKINDVNKNSSNEKITNTDISNRETKVSLVENKNLDLTSSSTQKLVTTGKEKTTDINLINQKFSEKMPEISSQQLSSFLDIAILGKMEECEKIPETADKCKYYFSIYKNRDNLCGDIEDQGLRLSCYKELVPSDLPDRFSKCNQEKLIYARVNCLNNLFWATKTIDSCAFFEEKIISQTCIDIANLSMAIKENKEACLKIKDVDLGAFCEKLFVPGDFDKDGLSDAEELKLGTNPYKANTDGDGYSDKEEIEKGYNPCGEGVLPGLDELLEICSKLKK